MKKITFLIPVLLFNFLLSGQSDFKKQPYLIYENNNTSMRVLWQLEVTEVCNIYWGTDTNYTLGSWISNEYGDDHQHSFIITGLNPGTKYYYKVTTSSQVHTASFKTAPYDYTTNLKFFVYGDPRSNYLKHDQISEMMIEDYEADPEFQTISLCTGDLVTYGAKEYDWQNQMFNLTATNLRKRMAEIPFISCLGNHELYENFYSGINLATPLFGKYFPYPYVERRYWSFDYGPMHVVVVDQYPDYYTMGAFEGYIDSVQLNWIEQDLQNTNKLWKVVILHEPGWSCEGSSSGISHPNNPDVQNLLQPVLEQNGVQILFSAHNHYYARGCKNGVYHITTAGGGASLYEIEEDFPNIILTKKVNHYCQVEIAVDQMTVRAISIERDTIDEFIVDRDERPSHLLGFLGKADTSNVISEALIETDDHQTHADETGYYGLNLDPGIYDVTYSLQNYYPIMASVEIFEGTETEYDTVFQPLSVGFSQLNNSYEEIFCYPNPFTHMLHVRAGNYSQKTVSIELINATGVSVTSYQFSAGSSRQNEFVLKADDLPNGIYVVRMQMGDVAFTRKVIKQGAMH
jgi:hypothetical protein